jgi:hypothetical protein
MPEGPAVGRVEAEAESIDDVEHGASIECAMVERPKLRLSFATFRSGKSMTRTRRLPRDSSTGSSRKFGRTNVHVSGAFPLHN